MKNGSLHLLPAWLLSVCALLCFSCAGQDGENYALSPAQSGAPAADTGGGLPAPATLELRASSGAVPRFASGAEFEPALPQRNASAAEDSLTLSPGAEATGGLAGYAYAGFAFDLSAGQENVLHLEWAAAPDPARLHFAFANWERNRWDFVQSGQSSTLGISAVGDYLDDEGRLALVLLLEPGSPATLDWLRLGENLDPVASFSVTPQSATVPFTASFDASESIDLDGSIVNFKWDLNGDGEFEHDKGTDPLITQDYVLPGDYSVGLLVTAEDGGQHSFGFTIQAEGNGLPEDGWSRTWGLSSRDRVYGCAVSPEGLVHVMGGYTELDGENPHTGLLHVLYSPAGELLSTSCFKYDDYLHPAALSIRPAIGDAWLTGRHALLEGNIHQILLLNYDNSSALLASSFSLTATDPSYDRTQAQSLCFTDADTMYVAADFNRPPIAERTPALLKFDLSSGIAQEWGKRWDVRAYPFDVTPAPDGGAYLIGYYKPLPSRTTRFICHVDASGEMSWLRDFSNYGSSPYFSFDEYGACGTDSEGNLLCCFTISYDGDEYPGIVLKMDSEGNLLWAVKLDNGQMVRKVNDLQVAFDDSVWISGEPDSLYHLDSEGVLLEHLQWDPQVADASEIMAMALDNGDDPFVVGFSANQSGEWVWGAASATPFTTIISSDDWSATVVDVEVDVIPIEGEQHEPEGVEDSGAGDDDAWTAKAQAPAGEMP